MINRSDTGVTAGPAAPVDALEALPGAGEKTSDSSSAPAPKKRRPKVFHTFGTFMKNRWNAISLSTKLVALLLVLITIAIGGISFSIRQMVSNYLIEKVDAQLIQQAQLVLTNVPQLRENGAQNNSPNVYFLQIRDTKSVIQTTPLSLKLQGGVESEPILPASGSMDGIEFGVPFTTQAMVTVGASDIPDRDVLATARAPWRVVAMRVLNQDKKFTNIVYIGLSLADQLDVIAMLTRYCLLAGAAIIILSGTICTILVQAALAPLKRIEKTAARIAAGDLQQRLEPLPEHTEIGSLSASLNSMLSRIEQSFKEQQATTEQMKRFVSDASHELRTPLAAIHGYAELYAMQRDLPGALERADQSIAHIEASSARMTVLVEDLLSLARLDEGRGIDISSQINVTTLVQDSADDLHALDPQRVITTGNIELQHDSSDHVRLQFNEQHMPSVELTADGSRLRQVMTNIVGNIHRYTPSDSPAQIGMGVLTASLSPQSLSQMPTDEASLQHFIEAVEVGQSLNIGMKYAVIQVIDHGPGVSPESRARIFERFYTADASRAREKGGTGLGMAIVQSIVRAHQGFICASATQGGGLTITVILPIEPVAPQVQPTNTNNKGKTRNKARNKEKTKKERL